ncbi:MAG: CdaR family protein [Chloroflexota bacterium]
MKILRAFINLISGLTTLLLSLLLAVIIWVTATQANDPTIIKPLQIPVTIPIPSGSALITPANPELNVTITVEGPASILDDISRDDFSASIDIASVEFGSDTAVNILVQQIGAGATITSQDPLNVVIHLEQLVTVDIPIEAEIRGEVARGHSMGAISLNPLTIAVTGIESEVTALDFAQATIFLNNDRETLIETRPLIFYDAQGQVASLRDLQLSSRDVEVTIPVSEAADFAEKIITIDLVGEPASGYRILSTAIEPSTVLVQGRPTQLDVLTNVQTEPIDITGLVETFEAPVALDLPDGIELDEFTEIVVTVEIAPFQSTQTFRRIVEVQGLGDDLEAEISPQTVRIVLFGPSPILQALGENEVSVSVDLFGLDVGTHSGLAPDADFPDRGIELRSIEPAVISANITQTVTMTQEITSSVEITTTSQIKQLLTWQLTQTETAQEETAVFYPSRFINKPQELIIL